MRPKYRHGRAAFRSRPTRYSPLLLGPVLVAVPHSIRPLSCRRVGHGDARPRVSVSIGYRVITWSRVRSATLLVHCPSPGPSSGPQLGVDCQAALTPARRPAGRARCRREKSGRRTRGRLPPGPAQHSAAHASQLRGSCSKPLEQPVISQVFFAFSAMFAERREVVA